MTITPKQLSQVPILAGKNTFNTVYGLQYIIPMSSTVSLLLFCSAAPNTTPSARVMTINEDGSVTYGAVFAISTGATKIGFSGVALSTTAAIIIFADGANSSYGTGIIATISGMGENATVAFGDKYVFNSATSNYGMSCNLIDTTHVFIAYGTSTTGTGVIATITGTAIAYGTPNNFSDAVISNSGTYNCQCALLDSTHVIITYWISETYNWAVVAVISGETISSYGTPVNLTGQGEYQVNMIALSATSALVTGYMYTQILSISDTTITIGSAFSSGLSIYSNLSPFLMKLSSTSIAIFSHYSNTGYYNQLIIATISGTNITFGDIFSLPDGYMYSTCSVATQSSTQIVVNIDTDTYILNVSGTEFTMAVAPTTLLTGASDHTEISSIYLFNPSATAIIVTLLISGTGASNLNVFRRETITGRTSTNILMPNSPIVLADSDTLRAYSDGLTSITATCFGLEVTV
jgi:hypothetical protein